MTSFVGSLTIIMLRCVSVYFLKVHTLFERVQILVNMPVLVFFVIGKEIKGARGGVVVKALRYKPAGRRFDSRWSGFFQ